MIVKNESHVIEETLKNIYSYIPFDTYAISDTGSTDSTKDLIKAFFDEKGVSGEIHDDEWIDFGYNRTIAFRHAFQKADYAFVWDADDRIHGLFKLPEILDADYYQFTFRNGDTEYVRSQLFNNHKRWKYVGVLHEYPACEEPNVGKPISVIGNYTFSSNRTGARNKDPLKYQKDADILDQAFYKAVEEKDPIQNRYAYYCAQSYRSAKNSEKAMEFYKKVIDLKDSWFQEKYNSCIEVYTILEELKREQEGISYLIESYKYDKTRVEGIYRLIKYYCIKGQPEVALAFYGLIQDWYEHRYDPNTLSSRLFAKKPEYDFYLPYYMIIIADRLKKRELGVRMYQRIFDRGYIPGQWWAHNLIYNLQFFLSDLPANLDFLYKMITYVDHLSLKLEHRIIIERAINHFRPFLGAPLSIPFNKVVNSTVKVMMTFTTCKRLDLFQQTVNSILRTWTDFDQVDLVFCVDDNSSDEDRATMRSSFPWIEYYMKSAEQKGHRESMNIIWNKLGEVKPDYWIHLEDDWLFFKPEAYVSRGILSLNKYKDQNVHQIVFNRNYGVVYSDMCRVGGKLLEPGLLLHEKREGLVGKNCGYWPHYSLQPSILRTETILNLGNYDSPNTSFERDYADKYYAKGYKTAFFNAMYSVHIGKQHWETDGKNAYALNDEKQFNSTLTTR
jgi:tetratricopeptide (TPR) repeat protein